MVATFNALETHTSHIEIATEIIKEFEGLALKPYLCPAGIPTIGYGHVIRSGEFFSCAFSEQEAEELLRHDVAGFSKQVLNLVPQKILHAHQKAALISFSYNVGCMAFRSSTLRRKIMREDSLYSIASEFDRWVYAKGQKLTGLVRRRKKEKLLFLQGGYS